MRLFFLLLALGGTVPLAHAATEPPPAKSIDVLVKQWLAFFDELVDAVVADKDDCSRMSRDVNALIDQNAALVARAAALKGTKLPEEAHKHMMASAQRMTGAMQKCGNDRSVQAAFQRLSSSPAGH
jgi:hypothetical protein